MRRVAKDLRFCRNAPALTPARPWENALARTAQWAMPGLLVAFAVTGYVAVATNSRIPAVSVLGLFDLPKPTDPDRTLHGGAEDLHSRLSHGFAVLVLLHVAGAFKRTLMDRDGTLMRMIRPRRSLPGPAE